MYEKFYGLRAKPFRLSPDPHFFFTSPTHKSALAHVRYGLHQGEGFVVVTGAAGTGKTTLIRALLANLSRREMVIGELVTTQLLADDLLRSIAAAFHVDTGGTKADLIGRLQKFFLARVRAKQRVLLVVDEAHNLPQNSFEELRMLSNFQQGPSALLQCILLGQPPLWDMLTRSNMEQLQQRIIAAHRLHPLNAEETRGYILHRLRQAGWRGDPSFSAGAIKLIHRYCHGIPRRINSLCDRILLFGALEERHHIDVDVMAQVYSEWSEETGQAAFAEPLLQTQSDEVNFAGLDNEHAVAAQAAGADTVPVPLKPGAVQRDTAALSLMAAMPGASAPSSAENIDPAATALPSPMAVLRPILKPLAGVAVALAVIVLALAIWPEPAEQAGGDVAFSPPRQAQQREAQTGVIPNLLPTPAVDAGGQDLTPATAPTMATAAVEEATPAAPISPPAIVETAHVAATASKPAAASARPPSLEHAAAAKEEMATTRRDADRKAPAAATAHAPQTSTPVKTAEQRVAAIPDTVTTAARAGDGKPPSPQTTVSHNAGTAADIGPAQQTAQADPAVPAAGDPSIEKDASPSTPAELVSSEELAALLERFKGAYDAGDTAALVRLFSDDARSDEANDRKAIARTYRKLFSVTDARQLALEDIRWLAAGKTMQGEGRFGVMVREKGRGLESTYTGRISLRIERRDGRPVITELAHSYTQ